ncbi:hypothetical protein HYR54_07815 [Candidatus Acetothermia bacterium]|nr:hypothetical protein [Candidatus Acetothermia bacterium]MBI3460212.1 hypothetical protein [Candidatus Acetothermia bacterium]
MSYYQKQPNDVSHLGLNCPECGIAITTLPFKPRRGMKIYCHDCAQKRKTPTTG